MLVFFLQKRSIINFDESDEEKMRDLLAATPACPIVSAGQSRMAADTQIRSLTLLDLELRGPPRPLRLLRRVWKYFSSWWTDRGRS